MKGKKQSKRLTAFNQHIPCCGAVGLEQADGGTTYVCIQGWCRPQLCHTKTLGIFQLFSAAICPPTASQKAQIQAVEWAGDMFFSSLALSLRFWEWKATFEILIIRSNMLALWLSFLACGFWQKMPDSTVCSKQSVSAVSKSKFYCHLMRGSC